MTRKFNVAIVGAHRGTGFIQPFDTITETEVTALCDLNEETLHSSPLIALSSVAEAGVLAQLGDFLTLLFRRMFG